MISISKISGDVKKLLKLAQPDGRIDITVYLDFDKKEYKEFVYENLEKWKEEYDIFFYEDDVDYSKVIGWHFTCSIPPKNVKCLADEGFVKEVR